LDLEPDLNSRTADIFVLIDGLGWEWVNAAAMLRDVLPYRRQLETVLGFSAGALPSILTGRRPNEHGRFTMYQRAMNGDSPFHRLGWFCSLPPGLVENRYSRRLFKALASRTSGIKGYFQIYDIPLRLLPKLDLPERNCIYRPGGIPGSISIFDLLASLGVKHRTYFYEDGSDEQLLSKLEDDLKHRLASFYFVYLAEVDAYLHDHADDAKAVVDFLCKYDRALRRTLTVARQQYDHCAFHVFSDHGMAPTRKTIDLQERVGCAAQDSLVLIDSTMARFWFSSSAARIATMGALPDTDDGRWLDEDELRSLGAWFDDARFGEGIYLLSEGVVFEPSHMGARAPRGMHGFHPREKHSFASFLATENYGDALNHITDIFKLMKSKAEAKRQPYSPASSPMAAERYSEVYNRETAS